MNRSYIDSISRRDFLKLVAISGAGLTLGMRISSVAAEVSGPGKTVATNMQTGFQPNAFVRVNPDNTVDVTIKHLEMGQGTYTGICTLVAEELDADWSQINPQAAPANAALYNNLLWGQAQGTGGSTAIANSYEQMRNAGAAAKFMLVAAAATVWNAPANEISVSKGVISHTKSGHSATFGELANLAAKEALPDPAELELKSPEDFVLIGKQVSRKDTGKTDGTAIYTQDIQLDGMLTAVVAHPPRFGAKLKSFDTKKAKNLKGVVDVVPLSTGVAVLAQDFWTAKKARDELEIVWDNSSAVSVNSRDLMDEYRELAKKPGLPAAKKGDSDAAFKQAAKVIEASYEFPFLAHAAMEPMNCVAKVSDEGCEIWNGAQLHTGDQFAVATLLGIKPEAVKINTLYAGGSFGRRANPLSDYVLEAVEIAKAKKGTAVKMVWTREDDTRAGYFRPMYFHHLKAGLDDNNKLIAWQHRVVGQSILKGTAFESMMVKDGVDVTSVEGASNLPYNIPNLTVDLHTTDPGIPVQWWRAVGSTHTAYSTEVFLDEIAAAAKVDPVEFRMQLLTDHPRHLGVLKLAAKKAGWGNALPKGKARGVAVHESFNSFVAEVAEVSLQEDGSFNVDKVVCAVDCGVAINPDVIKAQMEGGIGFGLAPALVSAIDIENGAVKQSNFHDYQVLRINQMPEVEVHIVPSAEPPTGVGEPGTPPIAPAVANALAVTTGKRYYSLPIKA